MKPYYYVYRVGDRAPTVKHTTLLEAQSESERIANQHPGSIFEILRCVGIAQTSKASTFWMDGEEPPEKPRYRMLEVGEIVQEGDEWRYHNKWIPRNVAFGKPLQPLHAPHRRPL